MHKLIKTTRDSEQMEIKSRSAWTFLRLEGETDQISQISR